MKYILILKVKARCAKPAVCDELLTCAPHSGQRNSLYKTLYNSLKMQCWLLVGKRMESGWHLLQLVSIEALSSWSALLQHCKLVHSCVRPPQGTFRTGVEHLVL